MLHCVRYTYVDGYLGRFATTNIDSYKGIVVQIGIYMLGTGRVARIYVILGARVFSKIRLYEQVAIDYRDKIIGVSIV